MPWLILSVAVPVVIKIVIAGADQGFFLGGGAPLRNDVTDRWGKHIFKAFTGSIFMFHCLVFFGTVGLFRSDMLLIFYMVWPWFSCGTVCVCPQLPYRGNDVIFWIFPIVPCHAFCMWHWAIGKDLDLSFIWGHHHLSEYMDISRPAEYFIACYTVLMRPNKLETAVHGCNSVLAFSLDSITSLPR